MSVHLVLVGVRSFIMLFSFSVVEKNLPWIRLVSFYEKGIG